MMLYAIAIISAVLTIGLAVYGEPEFQPLRAEGFLPSKGFHERQRQKRERHHWVRVRYWLLVAAFVTFQLFVAISAAWHG